MIEFTRKKENLNDIKDSYSLDGEKEGYIIERYFKVKMLIIDNLGKE